MRTYTSFAHRECFELFCSARELVPNKPTDPAFDWAGAGQDRALTLEVATQHLLSPRDTEFGEHRWFRVGADHCGAVRLERYGQLAGAAAEIDDEIVGPESDLRRQRRRLEGGKVAPVFGVQLRRCSTEFGLHPASLAHHDSGAKGMFAGRPNRGLLDPPNRPN